MSLAEKIVKNVKKLPELKQIEVLDFIEYLRAKTDKQENIDWSLLSLSAAMCGLENEQSLYSINDLKEPFS